MENLLHDVRMYILLLLTCGLLGNRPMSGTRATRLAAAEWAALKHITFLARHCSLRELPSVSFSLYISRVAFYTPA